MTLTDTDAVAPISAALVLGIVQGLTEFLPVSSSGHLGALQLLAPEMGHSGVTLEVAVHLGTTLAVLLYYRHTVATLLGLRRTSSEALAGLHRQEWWFLLAVGTIPTAVIGFLGRQAIRAAFDDLRSIAAGLAITAIVLTFSRLRPAREGRLGVGGALAIGVAQGFAIFPGISRSGLTITAALMLGVPHRQAVTYSLLLSVPAVFGATLLDGIGILYGLQPSDLLFMNLAFATLSAVVVGFICIGLVHRATRSDWWHRFAWYCWPLAAVLAYAAW